ncbi:hypothetical protein CN422_25045 [Bacillus cereus]|uniref:EndoU domain-containing protein n=1 Tax=Bacillus cereus TaxID=1396 RepID=UPI000BF3823B|nr:EndoU domain-containing protein [Bacillus cereus]PEV55398.1 hypothetical protein CN422_25045 [Bacillus cereus]
MSLNMYLGEVQNQTQSMNAVCTATIQGMEQVIQSIDAFAIDTVLQGRTYSSAKIFFVQTFRPLAQGIIYLCEELIRQNDAFPRDFQSKVASTDVIEQEVREQIQQINQMIASIEVIDEAIPMPGIDAIVAVLVEMRKKLEEKLEHLYEFNYTSSNNYRTALQLVASIATGLAEVQSGKGFSPVSGTFSTQGLNMEWITSIQSITEDRKRQADNLLNSSLIEEGAMCGPLNSEEKDESLLDKFKHNVEYSYKEYSKMIYAADHKFVSTIEKAGLGVPYHLKKGIEDALGDELLGIVNVALHPINTIHDTIEALSNPARTFNAIKQTISDSWNTNVVNGEGNSQAELYGNVMGHGMFAFAGTKGVDKLAKSAALKTGAEVAEISQASKKGLQDVASLFNGNRNGVAIAGEGGLQFNTPDFRQFEEKLSTHQFAKDEFGSSGNKSPDKIHQSDIEKKQWLESLQNTENFKQGTKENGINHIFNGEILKNGNANGFHYEGTPNSNSKIVGDLDPSNEFGVYQAKVEIDGVLKGPKSTFFPRDWTPQQVIDAVNEAFNNKVNIKNNRYLGKTSDGMTIEMILRNNKVISAYPVY